MDDLIGIALKALRDTLPPDADPGLNKMNTAVGYLSKDTPFIVIEDEAMIQTYLDRLPPLAVRSAAAAPAADDTAMNVDDGN